jgi:hypothetical protein
MRPQPGMKPPPMWIERHPARHITFKMIAYYGDKVNRRIFSVGGVDISPHTCQCFCKHLLSLTTGDMKFFNHCERLFS